MTVDSWLQAALADAERRGLPDLKPLLESARARDHATLARRADLDDRPTTRRSTLDRTLTIEEFGRRLRARRGDAQKQVTEDCLRRIDDDNPRLNAFILVMADDARQQAREADRELAAGRDRGPLHGVPISIKDLIDIAGTPTTAASRVREGHVAEHDAPVDRRTCGRPAPSSSARPICTSSRSARPTRSPRSVPPAIHTTRRDRPAARAAGRRRAWPPAWRSPRSAPIPAGRSASRPPPAASSASSRRYGEVSTEGVVPLSRTLDHVGPLARTVTDASLVYRALARAIRSRFGRRAEAASSTVCGWGCRGGISAICWTTRSGRASRSARRLRAAGARIDDIDDPARGAHPAIYLAPRARRRGRLPRGDARDDARALHAAGADAPRDGPVRARGGLRAGARRAGDAAARGRRCPGGTRCAGASDAADSSPADLGADTVRVGSTRRAGAQPDASADAALQSDRPPRRLAAVRANRDRAYRAGSAGRRADADRALLRVALACRDRALSA